MSVERLDHLVLTVRSIESACDFYARILGMNVVTFEGVRTALAFGSQKINLHGRGKEFEPRARVPTPGSADLCFITPIPMPDVVRHLRASGVGIIEDPCAGPARWAR